MWPRRRTRRLLCRNVWSLLSSRVWPFPRGPDDRTRLPFSYPASSSPPRLLAGGLPARPKGPAGKCSSGFKQGTAQPGRFRCRHNGVAYGWGARRLASPRRAGCVSWISYWLRSFRLPLSAPVLHRRFARHGLSSQRIPHQPASYLALDPAGRGWLPDCTSPLSKPWKDQPIYKMLSSPY
jgi:hypothetical protein